MSGRCELSDLPAEQCACRVHVKPELAHPLDELTLGFRAVYHGTCPSCEAEIDPGDLIVRHHDEYIHVECQ